MKKFLFVLLLLAAGSITKAQQIPSCQFAEVSYNSTTNVFQYHCPNSTQWVTIPSNGNGQGGGGSTGISGQIAGQVSIAGSPSTITSSIPISGTGSVCLTSNCSLGNPAVTGLTLKDVTGSNQCLHTNSAGLVTGAGFDCGSGGGGNGTVANPINSNNLSNSAFPLTINGDVVFKGPAPYIDARDYGARTMDPTQTPAANGITANCVSGNNQVTVSSLGSAPGKPNYLKVGDGIDLVGCGAAHSMTTPSQPTVASVEDQGGIGTNYNVSGPTGSTSRYYQIALMNPSQGITAASSEYTFSTGMSTTGSYSATITSCSKSGTTVTCTTSANHNITNGAKIRLFGTSDDKDFGGHFTITSVGSNTFTYTSAQSTTYGSASSATGGTVYYFIGDQVTLPAVTGDGYRYLIYISATSGTETLYGISIPQTSVLNGDTSWNKWSFWGFPITVPFASSSFGQQISYIPQSPPTQARNDTLVTTITAINGNTLTLAVAPSANVSNAPVTFDNAPAVKAANTQAQVGGTVILPTEDCNSGSGLCYYVFNSQVSENNMAFGRPLWLNDTLFNYGKLQGLPNSSSSDQFCPSFTSQCPPVIAVNGAYPGIYNNDTLSNATIKVYGNSGIGVYEGFSNTIGPGNGGYTHQDHVVYTPQNPTIDYSNIYYYGFGAASGSQFFGQTMDHVEFLAAEQSSGTTDAPAFIMKNAANLQYDYMNASGRGYFWEINTGGQNIQFNSNMDWQAVITPMLSTYGVCNGSYGGHMYITNVQSDTSIDPVYWTGGCSVNSNAMQVTFNGVSGNPTTIVSGWPNTAGLTVANANVTNLEGVGQNYDVETTGSTKYIAEPVLMGNPGSIGVGQLATPAAPVVTVTTSCSGGNIMTGNWSFAVVWFDVTGNPSTGAGGHSNYSPASATNSFNGTTQCASVAQPTPPAGAYYWGLIELLNNNINTAGWANEGAACPGVQMVAIGTTTLLSQNVTCQLPGNPAANTSALQYVLPAGVVGSAITDTALTSGQCVMATTGGLLTSSGGSCGGAGSTGTVTSFSAGTLSPLFTTSVATSTTTPALTFSLSNAAQNSVFAGPANGGAGAPSFQTAPTISAANMTNFPTLNQSTTGNAATATALASTPSQCTNQFATGIAASGNANCSTAVTTTGSPANGNLVEFSGAATVTNIPGGTVDGSGNITVNGLIVTPCASCAGADWLQGATAYPAVTSSGYFVLYGPPATVTNSWGIQPPAAGPAGAGVLTLGAPTTQNGAAVSPMSIQATLSNTLGGTAVTDFSFSGTSHAACGASTPSSGALVYFSSTGNCTALGGSVWDVPNTVMTYSSQWGFPEANNSSGTTVDLLATRGTDGTLTAATTSTPASTQLFLISDNAGTSGNATVAQDGFIAQCVMDSTIASAASGDVVINSVLTNGECHAQSAAPAIGTYIIGYLVDASTISGQVGNIEVRPHVHYAGSAQNADTFLANATGSSASPTAVAFPTNGTNGCAGSANALQYNTSSHSITCGTITAGGAALSSLTAASGNNTLANGNNPQVWNWAQTTNSQSAFTFGETTAATGTSDIELNVQTKSTSTALPIQITAGGTTAGVAMTTSGILGQIGTGGFGIGSTAHGVLVSENATTAAVATSVGATNTVLLGNTGADPSFGAVPLAAHATQSGDTVVMNATGSSAAPTAVAMPTSGTNGCDGPSDALNYNTSTHTLGCTTIASGGTTYFWSPIIGITTNTTFAAGAATRIWAFQLPALPGTVSFTNMSLDIVANDTNTGNFYDFALYGPCAPNGNCSTVVCDSTTFANVGTGNHDVSCGGTKTLTPPPSGQYYYLLTSGSATVMTYETSTSSYENYVCTFSTITASNFTATGQNMPTPVSIPASSLGLCTSKIPRIVFHN